GWLYGPKGWDGRDSAIEGVATAPAPFFQQPEEGGQAHEDDRGTEHPAWLAAVHQPTKEEGAENPADIETRRDDAEHAARRTGRGSPAHQHITGRLYETEDDARDAHGQDQGRRRQGEGCHEEHGDGGQTKANRRRIAMAMDLVGQGATQENAHGGGGEIGREC